MARQLAPQLRPQLGPQLKRMGAAGREGVGGLVSVGNRMSVMASAHYVRKGMFTWVHKNTSGRNIRNVRPAYPAWYINNGSISAPEGGTVGDLYVWASIEFDGVAYQCTKDGNARLSIASLDTGVFDPIPGLTLPTASTFREHVYVENQNQVSGFIMYGERAAYYALGDGSDITSPANQTMSGGATEQPSGFRCGYEAINIFGEAA